MTRRSFLRRHPVNAALALLSVGWFAAGCGQKEPPQGVLASGHVVVAASLAWASGLTALIALAGLIALA